MLKKFIILVPINFIFVFWTMAVNEVSKSGICVIASLTGLSIVNFGIGHKNLKMKIRVLLCALGAGASTIIPSLLMKYVIR